MKKREQLKAFAVDIDGVIVKDTFSPVIRMLIERFGGEYTGDVEKHLFSRPQKEAAAFCLEYLKLDYSIEEILKLYFEMRAEYIKNNPGNHGVEKGIKQFLELLASYNVRMICYGGLSKEYFYKIMGDYAGYFEDYVCTNDIRPGIHEIVKDHLGYDYHEVLFFDDVCSVALTAKELGVPFIGVSDQKGRGFQKSCMLENGIEHVVSSIRDINAGIIEDALSQKALI